MISQCTSLASSWVPDVVAQTDANPTTAPTDRSMPPAVMTNVMPMDTTPMTDARRRMVSTFSVLANRSPAVIMPTRHSNTRAMTRPRFRISPDGSDLRDDSPVTVGRDLGGYRAGGLMRVVGGVGQPGAVGALLRHAAVPPMTRSRTWFSSTSAAGPSCSTRPAATTSTRSDSPGLPRPRWTPPPPRPRNRRVP